MLEFICKIFMHLIGKNIEKTCFSNGTGVYRYSSKNYNSQPLEFKHKNIVYPDNKTEKEIEALYSEIRELQAKNREKIEKNKLVYYSR